MILALLWASAGWALDPSEMLQDPALEARARALDHQLRCVKCQSESISSSNAEWARDARRAVRERLTEGDSDSEVLDWFHDRYGDFVLMKPRTQGSTLLLWLAGPAMLLVAGGVGASYVLRRRVPKGGEPETAALSPAEEARLQELLRE